MPCVLSLRVEESTSFIRTINLKHKKCESQRFIPFGSVRSQVERVSFSQFGTSKGIYLFDPCGPDLDQVYSHLNVFNATTTLHSFWMQSIPKTIWMSSCAFEVINPVTTPGSGTVCFKHPRSLYPNLISPHPSHSVHFASPKAPILQ